MAIILIRTLIIYFTLIVTMRLLGKRQMGEMELSEFVLAALSADLAALPLQDIGIPILNGIVPILTLFCCEVIIAGITLKNQKIRILMYGKPSILVVRGRIIQSAMRKNRFTVDELLQELRNQSITDLAKVEYAILETDGQLNVLLAPGDKPVTASMMNITTSDPGYTTVIISDGRLLSENLRMTGKDEDWLDRQLKEHGAKKTGDVFLMTVNARNEVYYAAKEAVQ